jgi:hypothetical protein
MHGLEGDALRQKVLRVVKDLDPVYLPLMLRVSRLHRDIIPSLSNVVSTMGGPPPITSTSPRSHHTTVQLGVLPVSLQETEPTPGCATEGGDEACAAGVTGNTMRGYAQLLLTLGIRVRISPMHKPLLSSVSIVYGL